MPPNKSSVPTTAPSGLSAQEVIDLALSILQSRFKRGAVFKEPDDAKQYFTLSLSELEREVFVCLYLDAKHRVIMNEIAFMGTLNFAPVYPREIMRSAIKHNAASVIFAHNHPSGTTKPSQADREITRQLQKALKLIDVRVLDHIIVGAGSALSMAEKGCL